METSLCHAGKEKELRLLLAGLYFRFTKIEEEEEDDNYGVLIIPAERSWAGWFWINLIAISLGIPQINPQLPSFSLLLYKI